MTATDGDETSASNTAAAAATTTAPGGRTGGPGPLWRAVALGGVAAAVATTAVAAVAMAVDVPLEVDGEQIPLAAYAQLTLLGAALGAVLAGALRRWATRPRRTFVAATVVLTVLSSVPDLAIESTLATTVVLIATHVVAAGIIIPALAGRLPASSR